MALIVETGAGLADAESFCSVAAADTYHEARGTTLWATMTTTEKEQALRRGTDYMEQAYRLGWAGYRKTSTQALSWPRYEVPMKDAPGGYGFAYVADDIVPTQVVRACAEMAFRAAAGELAPDLGAQVTSETVGPISVSYAPGARQSAKFQAVEAMLAALMKASGNMVSLVRA